MYVYLQILYPTDILCHRFVQLVISSPKPKHQALHFNTIAIDNANDPLMISILRKFPFSKIMYSSSTMASSKTQRLVVLAQQLRLYKPPPPFDEMEEQQIQETAGKVVSQVGFEESITPIVKDPVRYRPKKAAVLICLFEGDAGDLRVILTKRSSGMSTHSGL